MTAVRDFRLLGAQQLAFLETRIAESLQQWNARWFAETPVIATEIFAPDDTLVGADKGWWPVRTSIGTAWIQLESQDAIRLLSLWLTGATGKSGRSGADWSLDFVFDLIADLIQSISDVDRRPMERPSVSLCAPSEALRVASGAVVIRLLTANETVRILFDSGLVSEILSHAPVLKDSQALTALARLPDSVQNQAVSLRTGAWLATELSIDAIQKLDVGDVVLLGRKADQPWDVFVAEGPAIAKAYIGKQQEKRVIKFIGPELELSRNAS